MNVAIVCQASPAIEINHVPPEKMESGMNDCFSKLFPFTVGKMLTFFKLLLIITYINKN